MGKQPYIPIYIGDWEQDTNCLTLEAEGAWLKIVFKCWKNKGIFLTNYDSLSILLKISHEKVAKILLELKSNNVCEITERDDGFLLIICRRIVREHELSEVRKVSGKLGGDRKKESGKQKSSKQQAKVKQTPEYEYENKGLKNKKESPKISKIVFPFDSEAFREKWDQWVEYRKQIGKPLKSILAIQAGLRQLSKFPEEKAMAMIEQSIANQWQGLFELKQSTNGKLTNTKQQQNDAADEYLAKHYGAKLGIG